MTSIVICSMGHNSVKNVCGVMILVLFNGLVMLYICTNICVNVSKGYGGIVLTRFPL